MKIATTTGIAGLSIEDSTGDEADPLFDFALAVERISAARRQSTKAALAFSSPRARGLHRRPSGSGRDDPPAHGVCRSRRRLLYAPGLSTTQDVAAVVNAVAPKPVNVLVSSDFTTVAELADLGVRRISVGGALARAAWGSFLYAASEIAEHGTFARLGGGNPVPGAQPAVHLSRLTQVHAIVRRSGRGPGPTGEPPARSLSDHRDLGAASKQTRRLHDVGRRPLGRGILREQQDLRSAIRVRADTSIDVIPGARSGRSAHTRVSLASLVVARSFSGRRSGRRHRPRLEHDVRRHDGRPRLVEEQPQRAAIDDRLIAPR